MINKLESFSDTELLALCVWREARGEHSQAAKLAVAASIMNRVHGPKWWGNSIRTVILKPWQYSSFNHNDPNTGKWPVAGHEHWEECLRIATDLLAGLLKDNTMGAVSYFDRTLDDCPPRWAAKMYHTCDIEDFHFYAEHAPSSKTVSIQTSSPHNAVGQMNATGPVVNAPQSNTSHNLQNEAQSTTTEQSLTEPQAVLDSEPHS